MRTGERAADLGNYRYGRRIALLVAPTSFTEIRGAGRTVGLRIRIRIKGSEHLPLPR